MSSGMRRWWVPAAAPLLVLACGDDDIDEVRGPSLDAGTDAGVLACDAERIERCQIGRCIVSAPRSTLRDGERVELAELPSASLGEDPLPGSSLCRVDLPARLVDEGGTVTLEIELGATAPSDAVLFRSEYDEGFRVTASSARVSSVSGILAGSGLYGVTRVPGELRLGARVVSDPQRSDTDAALMRNVSSSYGRGVTWDGTHTFLASGRRVLVYRGIPAPNARPELVLGQPTLDALLPGISAASFAGVSDIWSNGQRLAVVDGHRVLLWNRMPSTSFAPADLVLGQSDFSQSTANAGGLSASSMQQPWAIDSDGERLLVSELRNDRVLSWDRWPSRNGEPASGILGQSSFTTVAPIYTGPIYQARGAVLDGAQAWVASFFTASFRVDEAFAVNPPASVAPLGFAPAIGASRIGAGASVALLANGGLALGDGWARRVSVYREKPSTARACDFALGQVDLATSVWHPTSASSFMAQGPESMRSANPYLFVGDTQRTLVYDQPPRYFFEPADRVLGQPGFTTADRGLDTRFVSGRALGYPAGVAVSSAAMAIADRGNNRVLLFDASALAADDPSASVVLGQPDSSSVIPNVDQISASAATLSGPSAVLLVGSRLIVADTENHRVLIWNTPPTQSGTAADLVLGQVDMSGRKPNRNRGDADLDGYSDASLDGFFAPSGLASDGTRLFVTDRVQHRVLVWDTFPTANGQAASRVFGQSSGNAVLANRGQGYFAPRADGLSLPTALLLEGDSLYVADTENNRVLRWDGVGGTPSLGRVYGQLDGSTVSNTNVDALDSVTSGAPRQVPARADAVLRPVGLALSGDRLFVSEQGAHRVHVLDRTTGASLAVLGHATEDGVAENDGGIGAQSLASPTGLAIAGDTVWVADSGNHRVVGFDVAALTHAAATRRIGQPGWTQNGYSRSLPVSAGGSPRTSAVALSQSALYVAESNHNRVVIYDRSELGAGQVQRVLGQPDVTAIRPNRGGAPSAATLSGPRGVFVHEDWVFVADTENHRVLMFDRVGPQLAVRVLGQPTMSENQPNRGGTPSAASLRRPEGVSFDGTHLFVADTGNHRVLVWNGLPMANGAPADAVLGQSTELGDLRNQGQDGASAERLSSPSAVLADANGVFVADTQNNRVLRFTAPFHTGQTAERVFGQASPSDRVPAGSPDDLQHASGPVALAWDGSFLYVAERDGRRLLRFRPLEPSSRADGRIVGSEAPGGGFGVPAGLAVERTPLFTTRVFVSDSEREQVLMLESASRLR